MSDDLEERPTPDRGYPAQPEPRRRVRTPPLGVPVPGAIGRDSARELPVLTDYEPPRVHTRARSRADTDELEVDAELERAFNVLLKRRLRPYRVLLGAAFTFAVGAAGGAVKSAIDGARASERQLVRIEVLERDLDRVQNRLEPPRREPPALVPSATTAASPVKGTP